MNRIILTLLPASALLLATPATAGLLSGASLLKVADVVLKGRALLGKGQAQCGATAALKPQESLLVTAAGAAVQKALPAAKFNAIDLLANKQAATAALAPGFCTAAAQQKPTLVGQIAGAAKQLGVGGNLGAIAGVLAGSGTAAPAVAAPAAADPATAILGTLLGK